MDADNGVGPEAPRVDYAGWGERFFDRAVTLERVLAGVNVLGGRPIELGPLGVGPGRIAKVHATGTIGEATGQRVGVSPVTFDVTLPASLSFVLDLTMDKQRFDAEIEVPLRLTAHAHADLSIFVDVTPPGADAVVVRLKAQGLRASLTQAAAGVDGELRRFIAKYVAREVDKPHIAAARVIDVAAAIERSADHVVPR